MTIKKQKIQLPKKSGFCAMCSRRGAGCKYCLDNPANRHHILAGEGQLDEAEIEAGLGE
jgi:hypothetical protein